MKIYNWMYIRDELKNFLKGIIPSNDSNFFCMANVLFTLKMKNGSVYKGESIRIEDVILAICCPHGVIDISYNSIDMIFVKNKRTNDNYMYKVTEIS